jgi:hypothetical protein
LDFWFRAARRRELNGRIDALRMSRMPWAESDFVRDEFMGYQNALAELDGTKQIRVSEAWEEMKRRGRG